MAETLQQRKSLLSRALGVLGAGMWAHRPRRGGGFNESVSEEMQAKKAILLNPPCMNCTALILDFSGNSVGIRCKAGYSPLNIRMDHSLPLGENPSCIGQIDIEG